MLGVGELGTQQSTLVLSDIIEVKSYPDGQDDTIGLRQSLLVEVGRMLGGEQATERPKLTLFTTFVDLERIIGALVETIEVGGTDESDPNLDENVGPDVPALRIAPPFKQSKKLAETIDMLNKNINAKLITTKLFFILTLDKKGL